MSNVMVLTTTRPIHGVTKDEKKSKPAVTKLHKEWFRHGRPTTRLLYHQMRISPMGYDCLLLRFGYCSCQYQNRMVRS